MAIAAIKYKFQKVVNGETINFIPAITGTSQYTINDVDNGDTITRELLFEEAERDKITRVQFGQSFNATDNSPTNKSLSLLEVLELNLKLTSCHAMFYCNSNMISVNLNGFDTSNVQTMRDMFGYCSKLTSLDVSNFDTSNVTDMYYIFYQCSQLTQLDTSNWDTSSVTNMHSMFYGCKQLTQLDVSNFDTSNVENMDSMFYGCSKLIQLDVSNWVTSKVTNMYSIFYGCSKLTQLDVSNFDTSNVTDMVYMFYYCSKLTQLDVSNFDTSNVTKMNGMFHTCTNLTQLDVSNFNTSNVTNMNGMFNNCQSLTSLDISNFDTSKVTNTGYMFYNCISLTLLDLSNFNTSNVTSMNAMFDSCGVKNVGLIYCSKDTVDELANCFSSPCNFYVANKTYTSPTSLVKYVMYREDKKRILYYDTETETWEKPVLRQWDIIEKHSDGKYYYHKRSGEVVLNGSEDWSARQVSSDDDGIHVIFSFNTSFKYNKSSYMICDRVKSMSAAGLYPAYANGESLSYYTTAGNTDHLIYYTLDKSKLTSQDAEGFKAWLQANPTTVVYQLETEEVYECASMDLITYENETNFIVNTGAIVPLSTLKVMCNITNVVRELQQKVSNLENYIQHVMIDALNNALNE